MRLRRLLLTAAVPWLLSSCAAFTTVRSAEPYPGLSSGVQLSLSAPPGDVASWFWSLDCVARCNHPIIGEDLGVTYGWRPSGGPRAVAIGAGFSGVSPYVDGYVQLAGGSRPFGLGARLGLPVASWQEHQVYARYDIPIDSGARVLLNPGVFLHEGTSPNGANEGQFISFVQGVGLEIEGDYVSWTPAIAVVAGRARHGGYGEQYGPERTIFATGSLGITVHGRRVLRREH